MRRYILFFRSHPGFPRVRERLVDPLHDFQMEFLNLVSLLVGELFHLAHVHFYVVGEIGELERQ